MNLHDQKAASIEEHISTHTKNSVTDIAAVTTIKNLFKSDSKVIPDFSEYDKWPNIDGRFEFVPNPDLSRKPEHTFVVQIKGTTDYSEKDGIVKYSLKSLAFPAFMHQRSTLDPGILFVVLDPEDLDCERVFWRYMSVDFLNSINYEQKSITIAFKPEEEIKRSTESRDAFYRKLEHIMVHHSFVSQLDENELSADEIKRTIMLCDEEICESIDRMELYNATRDDVSRRILNRLYILCTSALLFNLLRLGFSRATLQLAWEKAMLNIHTKYLGNFLKALKYVGTRTPENGQSERLMLHYYDFLWQIRKDLQEYHHISVLNNLEKFPIHTDADDIDKEYYALVAQAVDSAAPGPHELCASRYYVQKKTPFFVSGERYYEVTLQLAGIHASKYDRVTAYTKADISTNYSVQIGYTNATIKLWGIDSDIRVITDWSVSIEARCLNRLAKILRLPLKLNAKYGEYTALMDFLTQTGLNLLDLIDMKEISFQEIVDSLYAASNTQHFKTVLELLRKDYNDSSQKKGRNVVRYLLLDLRSDTIERVLPTTFHQKTLSDDLYLSSQCYPFECNPFISNLTGKKTAENHSASHIALAAGYQKMKRVHPYLALKGATNQTGEIYFEKNTVASDESIRQFNSSLDYWERKQGHTILEENGMVYIQHYEHRARYILEQLLFRSKIGNKGQKEFNQKFLKDCGIQFSDDLKKLALQNIFVDSRIFLVYGAAGTGKTTLINYISRLMANHRKLYLTNTHAALNNLKRRIESPGNNAAFISLKSYTNSVSLTDYDVIFVDECSTIDNRTMALFFDKVNKYNPEAFIVMAGDIHQIESIDFGNWFYYAKDIVQARGASVELLSTWRTNDRNLISLWDEVRKKDICITEKLTLLGPYTTDIGPEILQPEMDDEVILCLNYDGKFGLNNMNRFFQHAKQSSPAVSWYEWSYKKGDRVLFNDSSRFPILYNNLKGELVDIQKTSNHITFTVDVETVLTEKDCSGTELTLIDVHENSSRIRFTVYQHDDSADDDDEWAQMRSIIPFQLAYTVSIHKAQGLEYDSVKIIIPSNNAERITHGIFYTAITRAKKHLKIYCSSETLKTVISRIYSEEQNTRSLEIIRNKLSES